jgi:hypothetical protein
VELVVKLYRGYPRATRKISENFQKTLQDENKVLDTAKEIEGDCLVWLN